MSNGTNEIERLWKVQTSLNKLILDGRRDPGDVADILQKILDKGANPYLNLVDTAILAPTKGSVTIAQSADVFPGFLDPNFEGWDTNVAGVDTAEMSADIYEMKKDGTYAQLFGSLTGAQGSYEEIAAACRPLCWQQGQIVEFARSHRALLRQDGYGTFFLFEVNGELFVARVRVDGGQLRVRVYRFSLTDVWVAGRRRRVVVPQQTV